jgi:tetratricopeptide (TPR) repeat protein
VRWALLVMAVARGAWADAAVPGEEKRPGVAPPPSVSLAEECFEAPPARRADDEARRLQREIDALPDDSPQMPFRRLEMAHLFESTTRFYATQPGEDQKMRDWLKAAVKEYLRITSDSRFSSFEKMDEALGNLANLLTNSHREDLARPIFKRLVKDHPSSRFIPGAYTSFGDYYLDQKDAEHALMFFDKVLQFPGTRCHAYAQYRSGLAQQLLGDHKRAMEAEVRALGDRPSEAVAEAAKQALVASYAQVGEAARAWAFFQRVTPRDTRRLVEQLASAYQRLGKVAEYNQAVRQVKQPQPGAGIAEPF